MQWPCDEGCGHDYAEASETIIIPKSVYPNNFYIQGLYDNKPVDKLVQIQAYFQQIALNIMSYQGCLV